MDLELAAILALRIGAATLRNQGQYREADAIDRLLMARQAGRNVDAHMQEVADALALDSAAPWDDIVIRIEVETDEFLARDS